MRLLLITLAFVAALYAQAAKPAKVPALDPGSITNNVYRNKALAFTYKIPEAWVLRTDELNAREESSDQKPASQPTEKEKDAKTPASSAGARVLLAAFSRPPEARGEDVNSSVIIAAEAQSNYSGLTDPVQYIDPLTEVALGQGFHRDEDPYEIAVGSKTLIRADFHKSVGSRVLRQSTLAMLSHGYAISITVIAGTDEDVEDLIDALTFAPTPK